MAGPEEDIDSFDFNADIGIQVKIIACFEIISGVKLMNDRVVCISIIGGVIHHVKADLQLEFAFENFENIVSRSFAGKNRNLD